MPWLTELLNRPVTYPDGRKVGRVREVLAVSARFPQVNALLIRLSRSAQVDGYRTLGVSTNHLSFEKDSIVLRPPIEREEVEADLHLKADLLDRQIVDTEGARVVRVNDVLLSDSAGGFRVVGVDAGLRGVLRQLRLERFVVKVADALGYRIRESLIGWNYVARIEEGPREVRLTVPSSLLRELHPSELADILDELDPERRERILRVMTVSRLAETLAETEPAVSSEALEVLGEERARRVLEAMPPDEATDLLGAIGYERSERLLSLMGLKQASVLRELLGFPPDTAGGRMTPSFVGIKQAMTAGEAIEAIRAEAQKAETIYYAYVLDEQERLLGILSFRDLLRAASDRPVADIMVRDIVSVDVADDQEEVARTMARYDFLALPVIDETKKLRGIVTVDDVVEVFEEEASEDLAEVSGIYLGEGTGLRAGRLAGFGFSLLGGAVAAALLSSRGSVLGAIAAVAWLLPLYLRITQDLGTWSLARSFALIGLTTAKRIEALTQELLAALASAAFSGIVVGGFGAIWTSNGAAGLFLGVGIFVGSLAASVIGLAIPPLIRSLRLDWVLARGRPLAITVGLLSLVVYVWTLGSLAVRLP